MFGKGSKPDLISGTGTAIRQHSREAFGQWLGCPAGTAVVWMLLGDPPEDESSVHGDAFAEVSVKGVTQ